MLLVGRNPPSDTESANRKRFYKDIYPIASATDMEEMDIFLYESQGK
jgi:hypothetical protein